ncbi:MAG: hypothetical protein ABSF26_19020 [Thermoguttaceae bacterium]
MKLRKDARTKEGNTALQEKRSARDRKSPPEPGNGALRVMESRNGKERRMASDRRQQDMPAVVERRQLPRRAKVNRRRQIDPTTCERDYSPDELEFMNALDEYKRRSGRMFPTCSEILEVLRDIGYEKRLAAPPLPATTEPPLPTVLADQAV